MSTPNPKGPVAVLANLLEYHHQMAMLDYRYEHKRPAGMAEEEYDLQARHAGWQAVRKYSREALGVDASYASSYSDVAMDTAKANALTPYPESAKADPSAAGWQHVAFAVLCDVTDKDAAEKRILDDMEQLIREWAD